MLFKYLINELVLIGYFPIYERGIYAYYFKKLREHLKRFKQYCELFKTKKNLYFVFFTILQTRKWWKTKKNVYNIYTRFFFLHLKRNVFVFDVNRLNAVWALKTISESMSYLFVRITPHKLDCPYANSAALGSVVWKIPFKSVIRFSL